ncbi:MAG: hypothetical protein JO271_09035 [Verrucomicrobia bacterium]|nr:hypothetical protein [Verrucomicrobiota bacterium]
MNKPDLKCSVRTQWRVRFWLTATGLSLFCTQAMAQSPAGAGPAGSSTGNWTISGFVSQLSQGLSLITVFGFIAGCVMVIGGFLNARRDENWKMMVIYGIGVAGSVALMKALFSLFGGGGTQSYLSQF